LEGSAGDNVTAEIYLFIYFAKFRVLLVIVHPSDQIYIGEIVSSLVISPPVVKDN
jgi:hypothetical protein